MMPSSLIHHRSKTHHSAPALDRHRPRLRRPVRLARIASAILLNNPPVRSFSPCKDTHASGQSHGRDRFASFSLSPTPRSIPHRARGTASAPPTAISCLGAFRRRPPERVDRLGIPASENLHRSGPAPQHVPCWIPMIDTTWSDGGW